MMPSRSNSQSPEVIHPAWWQGIVTPGLAGDRPKRDRLLEALPKELNALALKPNKPFAWVVFLGGTGTGKSTLFDLFCGSEVSRTGVARPMTAGPVAFVHRDVEMRQSDLPFFLPPLSLGSSQKPLQGQSDALLAVRHATDSLRHLILVDTPDLDSLVAENQRLAEDLMLVADAVVFVASQEKYADDILAGALHRVGRAGKALFFVLNKAELRAEAGRELLHDVRYTLDPDGAYLGPGNTWALPFAPSDPLASLPGDPHFEELSRSFFARLSARDLEETLRKQQRLEWPSAQEDISQLVRLLQEEEEAAAQWLASLDRLYGQAREKLLQRAEERFHATTRSHIQAEIRKLFSRYDLLAGPRRAVWRTVRLPFRLLGLKGSPDQPSRQEALEQVRHKSALEPVLETLDSFQRLALDALDASTSAGELHACLTHPGTLLRREEAGELVQQEQKRLADWLEGRFEELTRELPRSKVYGIYSTSLLWGVLILSFEAAVGGGITLVEALIDSALAPFVTKGTVELFVYREVQAIGRELARRHREGLLSVLEIQKERFAGCLKNLRPPQGKIDALQALSRQSQPPQAPQ
jgi:hypothetical protein